MRSLKKSWTANQNVVNGEHFLLQIKKRVTLSTTLTTLTLIVFKEGQNFSHRSFHIMKIDKTISFVAGSFGLRGVAKLGEGGGGRGMAEMYVAPIPPPSSYEKVVICI